VASSLELLVPGCEEKLLLKIKLLGRTGNIDGAFGRHCLNCFPKDLTFQQNALFLAMKTFSLQFTTSWKSLEILKVLKEEKELEEEEKNMKNLRRRKKIFFFSLFFFSISLLSFLDPCFDWNICSFEEV